MSEDNGTGEGKKKKKPYTDADDEAIIEHVRLHGPQAWRLVAERLGRTWGSVYQRYTERLDPNLDKSPWTNEDLSRLARHIKELGTKWAEIQQHFPGRAQNDIRSKYYSAQKREARATKKRVASELSGGASQGRSRKKHSSSSSATAATAVAAPLESATAAAPLESTSAGSGSLQPTIACAPGADGPNAAPVARAADGPRLVILKNIDKFAETNTWHQEVDGVNPTSLPAAVATAAVNPTSLPAAVATTALATATVTTTEERLSILARMVDQKPDQKPDFVVGHDLWSTGCVLAEITCAMSSEGGKHSAKLRSMLEATRASREVILGFEALDDGAPAAAADATTTATAAAAPLEAGAADDGSPQPAPACAPSVDASMGAEPLREGGDAADSGSSRLIMCAPRADESMGAELPREDDEKISLGDMWSTDCAMAELLSTILSEGGDLNPTLQSMVNAAASSRETIRGFEAADNSAPLEPCKSLCFVERLEERYRSENWGDVPFFAEEDGTGAETLHASETLQAQKRRERAERNKQSVEKEKQLPIELLRLLEQPKPDSLRGGTSRAPTEDELEKADESIRQHRQRCEEQVLRDGWAKEECDFYLAVTARERLMAREDREAAAAMAAAVQAELLRPVPRTTDPQQLLRIKKQQDFVLHLCSFAELKPAEETFLEVIGYSTPRLEALHAPRLMVAKRRLDLVFMFFAINKKSKVRHYELYGTEGWVGQQNLFREIKSILPLIAASCFKESNGNSQRAPLQLSERFFCAFQWNHVCPHSALYTRLCPALLTWCKAKKELLDELHAWNGTNHGRAPSRPLSRPGQGSRHSVEPLEARRRHCPILRSSGSARPSRPRGSVIPSRGHASALAAYRRNALRLSTAPPLLHAYTLGSIAPQLRAVPQPRPASVGEGVLQQPPVYSCRPVGSPKRASASLSAVTLSAVSSSTLANHCTVESVRSSSVRSPRMVLDVSLVSRATTTGNRGSVASLTMATRPAARRSHPFHAAAITSCRRGCVIATKATASPPPRLRPRAHGACGLWPAAWPALPAVISDRRPSLVFC